MQLTTVKYESKYNLRSIVNKCFKWLREKPLIKYKFDSSVVFLDAVEHCDANCLITDVNFHTYIDIKYKSRSISQLPF